jgi:hypothetical protein
MKDNKINFLSVILDTKNASELDNILHTRLRPLLKRQRKDN